MHCFEKYAKIYILYTIKGELTDVYKRQVCESVDIPVFAIGGISENNFNEPLENGGTGVCLMSEFMKCENPYERVRIYK